MKRLAEYWLNKGKNKIYFNFYLKLLKLSILTIRSNDDYDGGDDDDDDDDNNNNNNNLFLSTPWRKIEETQTSCRFMHS